MCANVAISQAVKGPDTTKSAVADTSRATDTLRVRFIPAIGSLRQQIDSSDEFHSSQFIWTDAQYFGNLMWKYPGFFLRDLGEPAKPGQLNAWGVDWRGIAILMDGRPMNDPITGTYNLNDIPMEFIEQVEEFSGVNAPGQSWNAAGSALNFVTRQYNTLHPITKIRYVQSPNNNLLTDGFFTQNLLGGLNFMFGFQRQVSDGRFNGVREAGSFTSPQGAIVDNWNVRTRIRYNISDRLNIALTDFYNKDINGLNGGIDQTRSPNNFDNLTAYVNSPTAQETVSRRDVTLLAIGKIFDDSTALSQVNVYYTHLQRDFANPGIDLAPLNISDSHYAEVRGVRVQQTFQASFHSTEIGMQYERSAYSTNGFYDSTQHSGNVNGSKRTVSSVFLLTSVHPVDFVSARLFARSDNYNNEIATSYGVGVSLGFLQSLKVSGGFDRSYRFPTFQESSWADSTIVRPSAIDMERHTVYSAGIEYSLGNNGQLSVTAFDRNVSRAIVFQPAATPSGNPAVRILNVPTVHTSGLTGKLNLPLGPFAFEGTLNFSHYKEEDTVKTLSPPLILSGELSYRNKFFGNALDAKFAIRSQFMDRQQGTTFIPRYMMYTENKDTTTIGRWTRLDAYVVLKLGNAYLTLSYENLFNSPYLITPVYPMPDRTLRFGVNWVFND